MRAGVRKHVVNARDARRQHSVARHHVEDAHLSEQRREHDGRVPGDAADRDDPVERVILGHRAERVEHRRAVGEPVEAHHADGAQRQRDVENAADDQRQDDADRDVALGTLRLFRRNRHRVEPDVRKEHERRAREDAVIAERRERMQVRRTNRVRDRDDEDEHRRRSARTTSAPLTPADSRMPIATSSVISERDDAPRRRRSATCAPCKVGGLRPRRKDDADVGEHVLKVIGERRRGRREREAVLEDQVPADDPRDELAERRVGVGVRAARHRNHRRRTRRSRARRRR